MNYDYNYTDNKLSDNSNASYSEQLKQALRIRQGGFKVFILCLVCVIITVAAGAALSLVILSYKDNYIGETDSGNPSSGSGWKLFDDILDGTSGLGTGYRRLTGELTATEIYELNCNACVGVTTSVTSTNAFGQVTAGAITGSGFIISSDGYIITNYHVIETAFTGGYDVYVMLYNGKEYKAKIVGSDSENDISLLKIEADNLTPVFIGDFKDTKVGETVYAIGNPLGELTYTMTGGIVSALDRTIIVESNKPINMFQIDAAINSGNSGGPVFNSRGQVIGIASAKYSSAGVEGLGFAVPINVAVSALGDLKQYGYVRGRPLFGISVYTASKDVDGADGALVAVVESGSCSEKAGVLVGDIITALNDKAVASSSDLIAAKKNYKAGDTISLTIIRSGKVLKINVTLDEVPAPTPGTAENRISGGGNK